MTTLSFKSKNTEINEALNLSHNKPSIYCVDFEAKTQGGMVPVGVVQNLTNVPARSEGNGSFAAVNALADLLGTNSGANTTYRTRVLVNEATAEALNKNIGKPLEGFELIVTDSFEPSYESQSCVQSNQGVARLVDGNEFYSTVEFVVINTKEHTIFKTDAVEATKSVKTEAFAFAQDKGPF